METTRVVVGKTFLTVIANSSSCFKKMEMIGNTSLGADARAHNTTTGFGILSEGS